MRRVAIIPARGGSKRLPRKNVIDFNGKPIIAYTIAAALQTSLFERVLVSTEDAEIAKIAETYGAEVIHRPSELATDTVGVVDVCLHGLEFLSRRGEFYDILCCLYATAPLRNALDIRNTVDLVQSRECDFAMAVTDYHYHAHQAMTINDRGLMEAMWPHLVNKRTQEVPEMVVDNGSTYAVWIPEFLKVKTFRGQKLKGYHMPHSRSVDINVAEDLELAEYFGRRLLE